MQERLAIIDVLRGIALFGILLVNIQGFAYPLLYFQLQGTSVYEHGWESWANLILLVMVQGKFYTMFSFLFGYSFILWLDKANERLRKPAGAYYRRMLALLVLGLAHLVFLWWGDILLTYALCGMFLFAFRKSTSRTMLKWSVALLTVLASLTTLFLGLMIWMQQMDPQNWMEESARLSAQYTASIQHSFAAYGNGTWSEIMQQRWSDLGIIVENLPFAMISVFPMFLIGAAAARSDWLQKLQTERTVSRQVLVLLMAGMGLTFLKTWAYLGSDPLNPTIHLIIGTWGSTFGDPLLSLAYIALFTRWLSQPNRMTKLGLLRNAGRMSLSQYLMQSLVCTTLCYSYGFALYGKLSFSASIMVCIIVYFTLVTTGQAWMQRFQAGPLEILVRRFVYFERKGVQTR